MEMTRISRIPRESRAVGMELDVEGLSRGMEQECGDEDAYYCNAMCLQWQIWIRPQLLSNFIPTSHDSVK